MSFHEADMQRLREAGGAALRVYERIVAEAVGCQDGSVNAMRKILFEQQWIEDPKKCIEEAEAYEEEHPPAEPPKPEPAPPTVPQEEEEEEEEEPEEEPEEPTTTSRRGRRR